MLQDEFESVYYSQPYSDTTRLMAKNIRNKLKASNLDANEENIFRHLIQPALQSLAEYATEDLMKNATTDTQRLLATITPEDIWEFLATKYFCSMFRCSVDRAFKYMEMVAKTEKFELMKKERYKQILGAIRGFSSIGRNAEDEDHTWMKQGDLLRHLNPMEKLIFQNSVATLSNKVTVDLVYDKQLSRKTMVLQ